MEFILIFFAAFFGWLFGLFSNIIIDWLKKKKQRRDFKNACFSELINLQRRLIRVTYTMVGKYDKFDSEFMNWFVEKSEDTDVLSEDVLDALKKFLKKGDTAIKFFNEQMRSKRSNANLVSKLTIPFLDTSINDLKLFDKKFSEHLLEIIVQVGFINDTINQSWFFFTKTFDESLNCKNVEIINNNLNGAYKEIGTRAKLIYNKIDKFRKDFELS